MREERVRPIMLRAFDSKPHLAPVREEKNQNEWHRELCQEIQASNQQWSALVDVYIQCSRILRKNTLLAGFLTLVMAGAGWLSNPPMFDFSPWVWMGVMGVVALVLGDLLTPTKFIRNSRDQWLSEKTDELLHPDTEGTPPVIEQKLISKRLILGLASGFLVLLAASVYLRFASKGHAEGLMITSLFTLGHIFLMYLLTQIQGRRLFYQSLLSRLEPQLDNRIDVLSGLLLDYQPSFELRSSEVKKLEWNVRKLKMMLYGLLYPVTVLAMAVLGYFGATATAHLLGIGGYIYLGNLRVQPMTLVGFTLILTVAEVLLSKACVNWSLRQYAHRLLTQGWTVEQRGQGRGLYVPGSQELQSLRFGFWLCLILGLLALCMDFAANCYYFVGLMHGNPVLGSLTALMPTVGLLLPLIFSVKLQTQIELESSMLALKS